MFGSVESLLADAASVVQDKRQRAEPEQFAFKGDVEATSTHRLRDWTSALGKRRELAGRHEQICKKPACVEARAELDRACTERDQRVWELQPLRAQLFDVAAQAAGGDAEHSVGVRAIQVALMEILDAGSRRRRRKGRTEERCVFHRPSPILAPILALVTCAHSILHCTADVYTLAPCPRRPATRRVTRWRVTGQRRVTGRRRVTGQRRVTRQRVMGRRATRRRVTGPRATRRRA